MTGTTVYPKESLLFNGVFTECMDRTSICDYACCQFSNNWIALLPGELELASDLGREHLKINALPDGQGHHVVCKRPCVNGEFMPMDCAIYPLFPANDDASLFIVANHKKCPIPNPMLFRWAKLVYEVLQEREAAMPGTIAQMARNGRSFTVYQPFPYHVPDLSPITDFSMFPHYEDVECHYQLPDTVKNQYSAFLTPEDSGVPLANILAARG